MGAEQRMLPAGRQRYAQHVLDPGRPRVEVRADDGEVVERAHHDARVARIRSRISAAALGMFVPGPKIALTPALRKKG